MKKKISKKRKSVKKSVQKNQYKHEIAWLLPTVIMLVFSVGLYSCL